MPVPSVTLQRLRGELANMHFVLDLEGATRCESMRDRSIRQIDDYILPRLYDLDAPLLVVVGGSTGAGKSTLVNTLVGRTVSASGAVRPTTRQPVLVTTPEEAHWFESDRILPHLRRVTSRHPSAASTNAVTLVLAESIPFGIAILDAPDIDSIADQNRLLARQLLEAADLWVFVTTANRYADAAAWELLDQAGDRNITLAIVLNRVPPGAASEISTDLKALAQSRSQQVPPIFVIDETTLEADGMLPDLKLSGSRAPDSTGLEDLQSWLAALASDRDERARIAKQTVTGAIGQLATSADEVADAREAQERTAHQLIDTVNSCYGSAALAVMDSSTDGSLLRGEVLARWQDIVGTSDVFRTVESWFSGVRDRASGWFTGNPPAVEQVEVEIETGVAAVIIDQAGRAANETWNAVRALPGGRQLFNDPTLSRESSDVHEQASAVVRSWQSELLELVRQETPGKRRRARYMSLGLNTITVALMVTVFASTGGLLGGEIAIAGGSAVIGQKLLETIFGGQAVRKLTTQAAELLRGQVATLFDSEAARYLEVIDPVLEGTSSAQLRSAANEVREVVL